MAVFAKALKPAKLKDKAMRAVLLSAQREIGQKIKGDFDKTTATWEGAKPQMVVELNVNAKKGTAMYVGPKDNGSEGDQKWRWIDLGTKGPYKILPGIVTGKSNKKALKFPGTFSAKSSPGLISSGAGSSGGEDVLAKAVTHPGIKARKWSEQITVKWTKPYAAAVQAAMDAAVKVSGNAL